MKYNMNIKYLYEGKERENNYHGLTLTEVQQYIKSMHMTYDVISIEIKGY